jgi:hypothetical protein
LKTRRGRKESIYTFAVSNGAGEEGETAEEKKNKQIFNLFTFANFQWG